VPPPTARRDAGGVIRKAFRASVFPGQQIEYERRHTPIWQELEALLIRHGVRSYSIYLDPDTNDLFGYVEVASEDHWAAIGATDVCRRWWRHMRDIMPVRADDSPVMADLREVFHLEPS
jgi:L-rhamnose mutarotase